MRARWLSLRRLMLIGLLAGACGPGGAQDLPAAGVELRAAATAAGGGTAFPQGVPTQVVTLPDEWARSRPDFAGTVWYRVSIDRPAAAPSALLALYIPRACSNHETYLNEHLVGSGGRMRAPLAQNCNHPQLVTLPPALLREGTNRIDLKVAGVRLAEVGSGLRAGGLSTLWIGTHDEMAARHDRRHAVAVTLPVAGSVVLALVGTLMFLHGLRRRRASHVAYFGVLLLALAAVQARLWVSDWPLSHGAFEFLVLSLAAVVTWAAVQFTLRLAATRLAIADSGLPLQCALLALTVMVAGLQQLHALALFWYGVFAIEIAAAGAIYLARCTSATQRRNAMGAMATVGVGTLLAFAAPEAGPVPGALLLAQGLLPFALAVAGLRISQRAEAAALAPTLVVPDESAIEQRVRAATNEIERNLRHLADQKVEQVTERERKRIAADLHDDLGAKLLTIVHTSESDRISTLAREALEEMRLSVRGLTGRPVRLADALGDWRAETVSRLAQAGIAGEWHAPDEMPQVLSSRAYVQTTRILREATSNIIKHSRASHCSVRVGIAEGDFQLVIQDDGAGISTEVEGRLDRGHGLASMKNRAKALQGQCLVESGAGYGTVIRLTLPLDRAVGAS